MSEKQKSDCPGSYEVSGYTTDSGKKVDSYIRRCWKHGEGGNVNIVSDKEGNLSEGTIYEKPNSGEDLYGSDFVSESDDFDNVIINLNEGENPFPNTIFQMTNPGDLLDSSPIDQSNGNSDGNWGEIVLGALLSLGTVAGSAYLSYLMNRKEGKTNFSSANLQNVSGGDNFAQTTYKNFELSKFDPKKTETDIKNSTKNIENILKQKEVSNNDISVIRSSLKNNVGSICNDIESISYRRSQQPEIPTVESMEAGKTIEKDRKQTIDNATNVITSINLAQNALKRNFDSVSMNSPEYNKKLYEYVSQSDELKKMSNSVMDLFQEAKSPTKNSMNTVNKIRQDLGFAVSNIPPSNYNGTTGSAANITKQKTPFIEDILLNMFTKSSADIIGKKFSEVFDMPEAYNLYLVASKGNNPIYVKENGKLYNSINEIDSKKYNIQKIKNRVMEETEGKLKDCKVLILKPNSSLAWKIKSSFAMSNFLKKNLEKLVKQGSIPNQVLIFSSDSDPDLYNSLHGVQINDIKSHNGMITFHVEDFYNFNKGRTSLRGRLGEKLQNLGELENYYIIIEISFGTPKI